MIKILILTDWFYPAYKAGGPITSLTNLVKGIGDKFNVIVLTSAYDLGESKLLDNLIPDSWQKINNTSIKYLTNSNTTINELEKIEFDVIYLNSMFSPGFTLKPLLWARKNKLLDKVILAPRGMLAEGALSLKPFKKKIFLYFFRVLGIHNKIIFHATSQQEVEDIKSIFGKDVRIKLIPNVPSLPLNKLPLKNKISGVLKLVSISRIASEKNIKYLIELLKEIKGNVSLNIFGMIKNEAYLKECENIIKTLPSNITVNIAGEIPSHLIKEKLQENDFFILPTLGENFGHAIYEALSTGTPVIISDKTPWRNLEQQKAGWDIPLDKPEKFIEVLNKCAAMDNDEYQQWRNGAYNFAKKYYEENDVIEKYLEMFGGYKSKD
jgi:glycosyltransferase involved in cell wall biosynthesis